MGRSRADVASSRKAQRGRWLSSRSSDSRCISPGDSTSYQFQSTGRSRPPVRSSRPSRHTSRRSCTTSNAASVTSIRVAANPWTP